ncbi:hypothetical protein NVP1063O_040 [Vibrio phage 1.063.O._10N.261.45.C7]|nr:hypothetical protein NVP1063O_040 [Vibrio phage 1.063.O._10N.261.45.C7]
MYKGYKIYTKDLNHAVQFANDHNADLRYDLYAVNNCNVAGMFLDVSLRRLRVVKFFQKGSPVDYTKDYRDCTSNYK